MSGAITAVVVTGYMAKQAAKKQAQAAADAQARALGYQSDASRKALEEQKRQFDLTREDTATQRRVGDEALNYLAGALSPGGEYSPQTFEMGDYTTDPGYAARLEAGAQARSNVLGANQMKLSGRAQKELERYGQDFGSAEYGNVYGRRFGEFQQAERDKQNYLARQMQLAGYGGQGINTAASAGQNMANQASNIYSNLGANQANIASNYGTNIANIEGQLAQNQAGAITGGIQNYLALQQQQRQNELFNNYGRNTGVSGDANYPAQPYGRGR